MCFDGSWIDAPLPYFEPLRDDSRSGFFYGLAHKKSNHLYGENLRLSQFLPMMERYFDRWVFSKTARLFYFVESIGIDHVG